MVYAAVWQDKIRILLNKADSIDIQQLMRVYGVSEHTNNHLPCHMASSSSSYRTLRLHARLAGRRPLTSAACTGVLQALMWQLGKVVGTPEPSRVYISSFWENAIRNTENK